MTHELILTSVAQGIDPGDHGFCPVAASAEIPSRILECLNSLNSYRQSHHSQRCPAAYSHLILPGALEHVLSYIADAGKDYRGRSSVFAHHIVLENKECCPEGPGWLLALPRFHASEWKEPPLRFVQGRPIPRLTNPVSLTRRQQIARQRRWLDPQKMALTGSIDTTSDIYLSGIRSNDEQIALAASPTSPCPVWEELTGDPGWGGVLAETAFTGQPTVLVYQPGQNILPLFVEALTLLPPSSSWQVTFCTYFTGIPGTMPCQWKGVIAGSHEAKTLVRDTNNMVLDLSIPIGQAFAGKYVDFARYGQEHQLPLDAEEDAYSIANAKTKSYGDETKDRIEQKRAFSNFPSPPTTLVVAAPSIQLPQKLPGVLDSFLRRSSRFQFYVLYGIMFVFLLFLLLLAVDQAGDFGIVDRLRDGKQPLVSDPPEAPIVERTPEVVSLLDTKPLDPENSVPEVPVIPEDTRRQDFENKREAQKEPLLQFLEGFAAPEYLSILFPEVRGGRIDVPEKRVFSKLAPLHPFGTAVRLWYIPLFELPEKRIETHFQWDTLPDLVWRVDAIDTITQLATPMFVFQLTKAGLEMDWQPEGLSNQNLYDTVFSSLGFLELSVADIPESAMEIPLFTPETVGTVKISELAELVGTETPEYIVPLPFATELWQPIFEAMQPRYTLRLEVQAEPAGDWMKRKPSPPSEFRAEVRTSPQIEKSKGGEETVFENINIQFFAAVSLEKIVWKGDEYTEQLKEQQVLLKSVKDDWEKKKKELQNKVFGGGMLTDTEKRTMGEYDTKIMELNVLLRETESVSDKLPEAYQEIGRNEEKGFRYSVFLKSAGGARELRILTTEF